MKVMGRKRGKKAAEAHEGEGVEAAADSSADPQAQTEDAPLEQVAFDRSNGPFDFDEVPDTGGYADFGAIHVPALQGLSVRLEADPSTGQLVAMTLVIGEGAAQVRALAAPRSGGQWEVNRQALRDQIQASGGQAEDGQGPFGEELHAMVPVPEGQPGGPGLRPMRFVGVEGPRWLLHGAFMGAGTEPSAWDAINDVFRQLIVVRGQEAMPVGALLALHVPEQPDAASQENQFVPDPLEPTDGIAEIR